MQKLTIMLIPAEAKEVKQLALPYLLFKLCGALIVLFAGTTTYFVMDYIQIKGMLVEHNRLLSENSHLKGEAQALMHNLDEVKKSLNRVHDYTTKLGDLVSLKVNQVQKQTGIGPLTLEEYKSVKSYNLGANTLATPLGISIEKLIFRPMFHKLASINQSASGQSINLKQLLSALSQKKSMLSSLPSISPVMGWVTSNFGRRISPFTGKVSHHKGLDIAARVGSPIRAPADGVVIFSGAKVGFGNFIMIAHYDQGIVTRYGHNAQNLVQAGQRVKRGDQIGSVGMTGRTTGPHLHYEVWVNGQPVNPRKFILNEQKGWLAL